MLSRLDQRPRLTLRLSPALEGMQDSAWNNLEGASAYSLDLDDSSSVHSNGTTPLSAHNLHSSSNHHHHHLDPTEDAKLDLNFDQLSISDSNGLGEERTGEGGAGANGLANLYEEDFEGMLDDLNRELPPHACR